MRKKDLIKHIKNFLEIEEKEFEIEQFTYFSDEVIMWRKRFLQEQEYNQEAYKRFLSILSENLMKNSPEAIYRTFLNNEEYED